MSRVPLRRSLLIRLVAISVLVAVCSIAATTWLVMSTTTSAIRQEQGQSLADDARIYDALLGYAAVHRDWSRVGPTVRALARRTGRRIVLTTLERDPLASSVSGVPGSSAASGSLGASGGSGPSDSSTPLPRTASATIDPLAVDPALVPDARSDRIDPRAVGPFPRRAEVTVTGPAEAAPVPPTQSTGAPATGAQPAAAGVTVNRRALGRLAALTDRCLRRRGHRPLPTLEVDTAGAPMLPTGAGDRVTTACFGRARRAQLRGWVAPPALLFVSTPGGVAATSLDLSSSHRLRIVGVALLVLALTILVTVLAARRLVRPLRTVTDAAERIADGDDWLPVPVSGSDELGVLAVAFNDMARRREQLEQQRTALVSDVAHELRTPVSNIRGWLEAAQDGLATPDPAFVASLLEEATLLHHVIDDLQDLSAAEVGELRLHTVRLIAVDVLEQVAGAQRLQAEQAGVALAVEGDRRLTLDADPMRLRQALGNLVANAIRHSPAGATVTLSARDGAGTGTVALAVADSGEGIDPQHLPHVFDRFWRAEKSRNRRTGGSGLGLAIVRKLVEAHGGTVTIASAPGEGATFTLRLPASPAQPASGSSALIAHASAPSGPATSQPS